jgi:quercetin dioxygenase-like cupin family protein
MTERPLILKRPSLEPMPDGTGYAQLLPHADAAGGPLGGALGGGLVEVPPGASTWRHNHHETELFVMLAGRARIEWDGGRQAVEAGDVVVVPPFVQHSFVNDAPSTPAALLNLYWEDAAAYDAAAARRAAALPAARADETWVVMAANGSARAPCAIAEMAMRALRQQGRVAQPAPADSAARPLVEAVLARLRAAGAIERGDAGASEAIRLERFRGLVETLADHASLTGNLKRYLADRLAGRLPDVALAARAAYDPLLLELARYLGAFEAVAGLGPGGGAALRWAAFFPAGEALIHALAVPVLVRRLSVDAPWPAVLHAVDAREEALADGALGAGRRDAWGSWLRSLVDRVERHAGGTVPTAGRWSMRHLDAFAALDEAVVAAARAVEPGSLALGEYLGALDRIVARAGQLAETDPFAVGTETLEAESRTTLALELAAARTLGVLAAPVAPRLSTALGEALGVGPLDEVAWSQARTLLPAGSEVRWAPLEPDDAWA